MKKAISYALTALFLLSFTSCSNKADISVADFDTQLHNVAYLNGSTQQWLEISAKLVGAPEKEFQESAAWYAYDKGILGKGYETITYLFGYSTTVQVEVEDKTAVKVSYSFMEVGPLDVFPFFTMANAYGTGNPAHSYKNPVWTANNALEVPYKIECTEDGYMDLFLEYIIDEFTYFIDWQYETSTNKIKEVHFAFIYDFITTEFQASACVVTFS